MNVELFNRYYCWRTTAELATEIHITMCGFISVPVPIEPELVHSLYLVYSAGKADAHLLLW